MASKMTSDLSLLLCPDLDPDCSGGVVRSPERGGMLFPDHGVRRWWMSLVMRDLVVECNQMQPFASASCALVSFSVQRRSTLGACHLDYLSSIIKHSWKVPLPIFAGGQHEAHLCWDVISVDPKHHQALSEAASRREMAILTFALDDSNRRSLMIGLLLELMGYPFKNGLRITAFKNKSETIQSNDEENIGNLFFEDLPPHKLHKDMEWLMQTQNRDVVDTL